MSVPQLESLDDVEPIRVAFDAAAGTARLLLLFSPT